MKITTRIDKFPSSWRLHYHVLEDREQDGIIFVLFDGLEEEEKKELMENLEDVASASTFDELANMAHRHSFSL